MDTYGCNVCVCTYALQEEDLSIQGGEWKSHHGEYWYEGRRAKAFDFSRDSNFDQLLDKVYNITGIDRDHYRVSMTTLPQTFRPSMPIEIIDDEDVALLLRRENVDPLVCISVEEIGHESLEMKHKPPEFSHNLHHATPLHESHHTHKSNIHVSTMDDFQRSDVPKVACLDDIQEGFTPIANIDTSPPRHFSFQGTTSNQHIPVHDETRPPFNYNRERVPNWYDEQFAHVQRLVPPPCAFYSINSGEGAPRTVTMRLEVRELFPSKKQLQSQVGSYALANRFQIRVFKSDTTRYQVLCIVEDCNWRLRATKVHNSDYFQIRKFDNQHTCSTEARFPHQRQVSARVIGEHIQDKFCDHCLYKPKEIIHDMQREFGISCNYHKGYRARHIALEEVQGSPVESYSILPSYLYMLEQANPGTVTDLHTDSSNRFMYMFFCLKACIDGFLSSIRPVIAFDGTFLKAFGVGDSETNEAWEWFLTRLYKAVGEVDDLVIVSDRKASITTGVEKVFPNSFHGASRVYRESQFMQRMEQLSNIHLEAAQYVTDAGIERLARAYSPRKRGVLQCWFHDRRTSALKLTTQLTTAADVAIGVKDDEARYMRIYPITFYTFHVKDGGLDGTVDLTTKPVPVKNLIAFLVAAYSGEIHPLGQPSEWLVPEDIASKIVHPPVGRRGPGRPKKNHTPSFGEEVTQRSCTTCHRVGHNSHTCTYPKSSRPSSGMGSTTEIGEASGSHN
ncbi:hypothetical protein Dsin_017059 [Dipteronia sinensis]|uniref:Transposase MuDR plant domain-containing protein n=1 Tax=Dipteronia sinensis TaxID=43782 RepID=A0AAE0AF78_9ROSI|nr:hypothetical protein Dsin_017059 [Dipteronia sinensis]